jgi:hypothetical protein
VARADLPARLKAFIAAHFDSVEGVELLMLLADGADRWWDADTVAGEMRLSPRQAQLALEQLAQQNLLEVRLTTDVRYQYHPGSESLEKLAQETIDAYRIDPISIARIISPELQRIRDFAAAFRIKR